MLMKELERATTHLESQSASASDSHFLHGRVVDSSGIARCANERRQKKRPDIRRMMSYLSGLFGAGRVITIARIRLFCGAPLYLLHW